MKFATLYFISVTISLAYSLRLEDIYGEEELANIPESIKEDSALNFTQLVTKYGYPVELHSVYTKDDYILTVHRIPYGKACKTEKARIPVLLGHGLFSSSVDFILSGPEQGLGYILADHCFDVWLGNSRGNKYSRLHKTMTVKDKEYWGFSWHEMGAYDMPAIIDYILNITGQPDLHYIGISQGTTQFFVFGSLHPEYHSKIRSAHALAPVAFMKTITHPLVKKLSLVADPLFKLTEMIGMYELLPSCEFLNLIGHQVCVSEYPAFKALCGNVVFLLTGSTPSMINTTLLPTILCHTPAGSSTKQLVHFAQLVGKDKFEQFDYGFLGNIIRYGRAVPPSYDVTKINIPTALYFSDSDWFADMEDVHHLSKILPNVIGKFRVPKKVFGHIDFIYGLNVRTLVYDRLLSILKRY